MGVDRPLRADAPGLDHYPALDGLRAVHDLRTRSAGQQAFIQFHLELDGAITLMEAHRISDAVEAAVIAAFPGAEVIIHQDPAGLEEPKPVYAR